MSTDELNPDAFLLPKEVKKLIAALSKLKKKRGSFSHMRGGIEVYNAPYYDDKEISELIETAQKFLNKYLP